MGWPNFSRAMHYPLPSLTGVSETLRQMAGLSERQISKGTGVRRDTIRLIRHGKGVKRSTYEKVINFLRQNAGPAA